MAIILRVIIKVISLELKQVNLQCFSKWFQVAQKHKVEQEMAKHFSTLSQKMGKK